MIEEDLFSKVREEMEQYCKNYAETNHKSVSYHMLAEYAYRERKVEWIKALNDKRARYGVSLLTRGIRRETKFPYATREFEARLAYMIAKSEYENHTKRLTHSHKKEESYIQGKKVLYYNPMEIPDKIRYISKEKNIDVTAEAPWTEDIGFDGPIGFDEIFRALKNGIFDEIIAYISRHEECYYWDENGKRVPVVGETKMSEFVDGGGYLDDPRLRAFR